MFLRWLFSTGQCQRRMEKFRWATVKDCLLLVLS